MSPPRLAPTILSTEADGWSAIAGHLAELVERQPGERHPRVIASGWMDAHEPYLVTPIPHGPDVVYDRSKVERVLTALASFDHTKGRWAGHPLRLLDWQVFYIVAPIFGIVDRTTGFRIIRSGWIEECRKNAKSTLCSGLGLVLAFADGEMGAEVYAAASSKDQAKIVFAPARAMAIRSAKLYKKLGPKGIQRALLENTETESIFRPLAADMKGTLHGLNVHGGIIDEVHVHKTPDTIDAIETGTGSRDQPLILFITTADEGVTGSIYDTKRTYVENLHSRTIEDPSFYGVVFAAPDEMIESDPFGEETLVAANPGIDYTVSRAYLMAKAREASNSPAQLNRYLRLHLGKRTKQTIAWLTMAKWDAAAGLDPSPQFANQKAWLGIDLSATTDFTAAAFLSPTRSGGYLCRPLFWIPEDRVDELARLTGAPLREWNRSGHLIFTEGNVVDYARVRQDINAERDRLRCTVKEVAYDPWNAAETVQEMQNDRYTMVPIRQGYASLSGPAKELERLVMGSTPERSLFQHGGHPVLRWMADCAEVMQDPSGNIKPAKPDRRKSSKRIDGIAAVVNALARAMLHNKRRAAGGST